MIKVRSKILHGRIPVVPENHIRTDSSDKAESAHDPTTRCVRSSICLGRLPATRSSRGAGLKSRISFSDISSRIALRRAPRRLRLRGCDRALLVWMTQRWPSLLDLACVVRPDTILRWHRAGFRAYWGWQSRGRPGRPRVSRELRAMIRRMCNTNPFRTTSSLL